jgi:hypothetical protein
VGGYLYKFIYAPGANHYHSTAPEKRIITMWLEQLGQIFSGNTLGTFLLSRPDDPRNDKNIPDMGG